MPLIPLTPSLRAALSRTLDRALRQGGLDAFDDTALVLQSINRAAAIAAAAQAPPPVPAPANDTPGNVAVSDAALRLTTTVA